ncbi:MAG TPA: hypothetical protein VL133_08535 [Devosia sp.]|nr:hypothetical protein [Devosia sp.]
MILPATAYSQTLPSIDAGAIQNQTTQQRRQLKQKLNPGDMGGAAVTAPVRESGPAVAPGGPTFVLTSVAFTISAFLSPQELAAIAAPYVGHPIDFSGIQALINAAAGSSGYYASLELHKNLSDFVEGFDVFAFVDSGAVYSTAPARVSLTAVGAGLTYTLSDRVSFELTGGVPVGDRLPGDSDFALFSRLTVKAF